MDKKLFQEHELDAFLGDFRDDYDVDGIIDEATEVDGHGNRWWRDVDLNEVAQRNEVTFIVTEYDMYAHQVGQSYTWDERDGEGEPICGPVSREEALEAFQGVIGGWNGGSYRIVETKTGLDTVEYRSVELDAVKMDGDGGFEYVRTVDFARSLPEGVVEAMKEAEKGYGRFLDYAEPGYPSLKSLL